MSRVVLSLGSNLGDRLSHLHAAVETLSREVSVEAVSPIYETSPVGGPEQGPYLNAVVLATTDLSPRELVALCQRVEASEGRERVERWGPRTLDIDLIAYDDLVSDDPVATVPHPRAHERSFVLAPWLDVDPDAVLGGRRVRDLPGGGEVRRRDDLTL
jgi:2-amino-4-hydroxy-6-hydroxymethyldihydropteridine diphosphokinase